MDTALLSQSALFRGANPDEIEAMLGCLAAQTRRYGKGALIYGAGQTVTALGLVLHGSVLIQSEDAWGRATVMDSLGPGQIFAETYACTPGEPLMVNVLAAEPCEVLFLQVSRILESEEDGCPHQHRLVQNLLALFAQKNLTLSRKIFHTSAKTIRERLLSYLSDQAIRAQSRSFSIPFDRQQLADYLNVDRSALSNELSKMQREGLIQVHRSQFVLCSESLPD